MATVAGCKSTHLFSASLAVGHCNTAPFNLQISAISIYFQSANPNIDQVQNQAPNKGCCRLEKTLLLYRLDFYLRMFSLQRCFKTLQPAYEFTAPPTGKVGVRYCRAVGVSRQLTAQKKKEKKKSSEARHVSPGHTCSSVPQ